MSEVVSVPLLDRRSKAVVDASLHTPVDVRFAYRADDAWQTFLALNDSKRSAAGLPPVPLEHSHWRWSEKVAETEHLLSLPTIGIECEGDVQGLMLLKTDGEFCRLKEQTGKPLVYVWFLASAPWNLPEVESDPRYQGVGSILMRTAIDISRDLEFKGRIGLHSLRRSEGWYHKLGFQCLGEDPDKKLKYFEMTAEAATAFAEGRTK